MSDRIRVVQWGAQQTFRVCAPHLGRLFFGILAAFLTVAVRAEARAPDLAVGLPERCLEAGRLGVGLSENIQSLASNPTVDKYNRMGALFAQAKEIDCAIATYDAALLLDPGSWDSRYNLGSALISHQDYERAAKELQVAVKERPNSFAAHNALGIAYRALGQTVQTQEEFRSALALNPGFAGASLNLTEIALGEKNPRGCRPVWQNSVRGMPTLSHCRARTCCGSEGQTKASHIYDLLSRRIPKTAKPFITWPEP